MLPGADTEEKSVEFTVAFHDDDWGAKIKAYRKKRGLTQEELAAQMGVKHFTLRAWEQGKAKPPYHVWRLHKDLFDDPIDFP